MIAFPSSPRARIGAPLALALSLIALFSGCGKLEPKECDKLRGDAFELLNKAHHCKNDLDCRQSDWPGCAKPISNEDYDKIKPMSDQYTEGKCEEPKVECKPAPDVYCKQGLCVHREMAPGGTAGTPADAIKAQ
jgi:hypothetical protein